MTTRRCDEIIVILESKLKAYAGLLSATLLLKQALEDGEMTAVDQAIKRREGLIGIVDGLDREMAVCREAASQGQGHAATGQAASLSAELTDMLRQILSANQDCHATAAGELETIRKELLKVRRTEQGLQGYARAALRIPKFFSSRL